jgi:hypothetical protein
LIYFFFVLFHQPTLHGIRKKSKKKWVRKLNTKITHFLKKYTPFKNVLKQKNIHFSNVELNLFFQFTYILFIMSAFYTSSFLPYGRFYNRLGGNKAMLAAYFYVLVYLTFTSLRRPVFMYNYIYNILKKTKSLAV